jgi:hypothetical protein
MTCPPLIWSDNLLLAGLIVYVCGMVSGLWLGFKLWRVTYLDRSLGTRR